MHERIVARECSLPDHQYFCTSDFFKWGMKTNEKLGEQCEVLLGFFIYLMPVFYQINVSIEQE